MSESKQLDLNAATTTTTPPLIPLDVDEMADGGEFVNKPVKSKALSISSTDSFLSNSSELAGEMHEPASARSAQAAGTVASSTAAESHRLPQPPAAILARDYDDDSFDFTVTGAKPKRKTAPSNLNSKSLSSSTSSSLSSLSVASHHSSALTTSSSTSGGGVALLPAAAAGLLGSAAVGPVGIAPNSSSNSSTCSSGYKSSSSSSSSSSTSHLKNKPASFDSMSMRKSLGLHGALLSHTANKSSYADLDLDADEKLDHYYEDSDAKRADELGLSKNFFKLDKKSSDMLINTSQELDLHKSILDAADLARDKSGERRHKSSDPLRMLDDDDAADMCPTCPLCLKAVKTDLETHFSVEHREFECHFCSLLFDTEFSLYQHIGAVHGDDPAAHKGDNFDELKPPSPTTLPLLDDDIVTKPKSSSSSLGKQLSRSRECLDTWELDEADDSVVVLGGSAADDEFVCPICQLKMKDQVWLEMHVDSHFNPASDFKDQLPGGGEFAEAAAVSAPFNSPFGYSRLASSKSRSQSASSLAANVDENFEIDQIMTLTECGLGDFSSQANEDSSSNDAFQNARSIAAASKETDNPADCSMLSCASSDLDANTKSDYELALMLDREERSQFKMPLAPATNAALKSQDYLTAQLIERQQNEMLKYKLFKENNQDMDESVDESIALAMSMEGHSDMDYASDLEHEWLKQRFGMGDVKATTKAVENLDRALKANKITPLVYHSEKDSIEKRLESSVDDSQTQSVGLVELIRAVPLNKNTRVRYMCTACDHFASGFIDRGYGCGYRNVQMLLSSIRQDAELADKVFNNGRTVMPSIKKIQQLIEKSWELGFDPEGRSQFGGVLAGTARWIGASDVCAMFSSLRIRTELVDIALASKSVNDKEVVARLLFKFVRAYFEQAAKTGGHVYPIYLQHDGHSRTIVGIEVGAKFDTLLLFDPGTRKAQIENFRSNPLKSMNIFRRSLNAFKKDQYQLLLIRGLVRSNEEYERSKRLQSTKVNQ